MGIFDKLKQGLKKTSQLLKTDVRDLLKAQGRLFDEAYSEELFEFLVKRDIGVDASQEITDEVYKTCRARVVEMLCAAGLAEDSLARYPHEFSGGQRQRIGIARALVLRPRLVVADEPVSALDVSVGAQILELLRNLQRDFALTYLLISHSLPVVAQLATRIAVMQAGRIVETGPAAQILSAPAHPYTQSLIAAIPALPAG